MSSTFPTLINVDEARASVSAIEEAVIRECTSALLVGTEQFFREQPSQLTVSFDMAFLAEIFQGRFREIEAMWRGEYHDVFDEFRAERRPNPVPDPSADVSEFDVRHRQACNYAVVRRCERTCDVLLTLTSAARSRQDPRLRRYLPPVIKPLPVIKPKFPVDQLFLVMAADYALRAGQELARILSGGAGS